MSALELHSHWVLFRSEQWEFPPSDPAAVLMIDGHDELLAICRDELGVAIVDTRVTRESILKTTTPAAMAEHTRSAHAHTVRSALDRATRSRLAVINLAPSGDRSLNPKSASGVDAAQPLSRKSSSHIHDRSTAALKTTDSVPCLMPTCRPQCSR